MLSPSPLLWWLFPGFVRNSNGTKWYCLGAAGHWSLKQAQRSGLFFVGCTQKKAGCMPPELTQVWGADSATLCLDKLKVGGCCMYRWALSLTQVPKVLTHRALLWEMLSLERVGWWPGLFSHPPEYVRKVNQIEILALLSLRPSARIPKPPSTLATRTHFFFATTWQFRLMALTLFGNLFVFVFVFKDPM